MLAPLFLLFVASSSADVLAPLFLLFVASSSADESIVLVGDLGSAQGILNPLAREFRGLPYAAPPVGALRWNAPARVQSWGTSVFPAINDGPGCLQLCHEPPAACPTIIQEDCLYLNVFTPREPFAKPAPVFVWIHGGNFKDSSGGGVLYNGSELSARQGVVVVSLNYRLGLQGFLFSNKTAEGGGITGNFGLLDQREALRFVQRYIGAFGGDPTRVTLGGQSAGAMSTAVHLISPESAGLYHGAVMLSEPFALPFRTPDSALDMAAVVLAASNCSFATGMRGLPSPAACMRSLTAPELLAVQQKTLYAIAADYRELLQIFMPLCPTTGTPEVPNWPLYSFQGRVGALPVADVPIFLGTTSQEGMLFIYAGFNTTIPPIEYAALMEVIFGPLKGLEVLSHYPLPKTAVDARPTAAVVTTTAIFKCAVRNASLSLSGMPTRKSPIFAYEFSRVLSFYPSMWNSTAPYCWDAVCHGGDLPAWWFPQDPALATWKPAEAGLSIDMLGFLGNFISNGNPNSPATITSSQDWPQIRPGSFPRMQLDLPAPSLEQDPSQAECVLWNSIGYEYY